ncbi:hypothetical protein Poly51_42960 [Rubripirellula tenax]|uniref:Uncharacterized protein n=1 Tax=Rubripirellula tenax TaxID=2528015 RepID=A0A5C6EMM9_9BACT|nr:YqgE/AlgH family protein [Rubripirellula tenax]TWU51003.1 hypothetical protein Poly51_42960 [Rubripirellula tenax]
MKDTLAESGLADNSFIGNLLVASSLVNDSVYAGGVCLIVHQDDEQVIGVMLNRPLRPNPEAMAALLGPQPPAMSLTSNRIPTEAPSGPPQEPGLINQDSPAGFPHLNLIHFGGPLSGPVVAIHQDSQFAESEPGTGIYLAAQKQHLESLLNQEPTNCRLIVGHLRWDREQFVSEIEAGVWHLAPATVETVFGSAPEMWPGLIRRATSRSVARWIGTPDVIGASELN